MRAASLLKEPYPVFSRLQVVRYHRPTPNSQLTRILYCAPMQQSRIPIYPSEHRLRQSGTNHPQAPFLRCTIHDARISVPTQGLQTLLHKIRQEPYSQSLSSNPGFAVRFQTHVQHLPKKTNPQGYIMMTSDNLVCSHHPRQ